MHDASLPGAPSEHLLDGAPEALVGSEVIHVMQETSYSRSNPGKEDWAARLFVSIALILDRRWSFAPAPMAAPIAHDETWRSPRRLT